MAEAEQPPDLERLASLGRDLSQFWERSVPDGMIDIKVKKLMARPKPSRRKTRLPHGEACEIKGLSKTKTQSGQKFSD